MSTPCRIEIACVRESPSSVGSKSRVSGSPRPPGVPVPGVPVRESSVESYPCPKVLRLFEDSKAITTANRSASTTIATCQPVPTLVAQPNVRTTQAARLSIRIKKPRPIAAIPIFARHFNANAETITPPAALAATTSQPILPRTHHAASNSWYPTTNPMPATAMFDQGKSFNTRDTRAMGVGCISPHIRSCTDCTVSCMTRIHARDPRHDVRVHRCKIDGLLGIPFRRPQNTRWGRRVDIFDWSPRPRFLGPATRDPISMRHPVVAKLSQGSV